MTMAIRRSTIDSPPRGPLRCSTRLRMRLIVPWNSKTGTRSLRGRSYGLDRWLSIGLEVGGRRLEVGGGVRSVPRSAPTSHLRPPNPLSEFRQLS
jgi:hypothetical protein